MLFRSSRENCPEAEMWVAGPRSKTPLTVSPLSLQTGAVWWAATCCAKKPSMNWTGAKDHVLGRWCEGREIAAALVYHLSISSSVVPFSSCLQNLPASESFPMSQLFASWLQSPSTVILEPPKIKSDTVPYLFPMK